MSFEKIAACYAIVTVKEIPRIIENGFEFFLAGDFRMGIDCDFMRGFDLKETIARGDTDFEIIGGFNPLKSLLNHFDSIHRLRFK